jgi:pimeloyl-ACP methyl ester carboxylesterase
VQQIALTEPPLVNKIILTGTGPKGSEGLPNLSDILASASNLNTEERFLYFALTASAKSRNAGKLSYEGAQKRTVNRDAPVSNESGAAQLTAVLAWAQPYSDALKELKNIAQPTLIVAGQEDLPIPVINSINMSQHIPDACLVLYSDAGHAAMFQYPEQFVQEASNFLDN